MDKDVEKIKFFDYIEITVKRLKDIDYILALLFSFVVGTYLIVHYPNKDAFFGLFTGVILTFGIGYFITHDNYEKLNNLYKEERRKNKEWEKYTIIANTQKIRKRWVIKNL